MKNKNDARINALVLISELREDVAEFVSGHANSVDHLIRACEDNSWNDCVAYDLKDALAKLGTVVATLVIWDKHVNITKEEQDAVGRRIDERKIG